MEEYLQETELLDFNHPTIQKLLQILKVLECRQTPII